MRVHAMCSVSYSFDVHRYEYLIDMPNPAQVSHAEILLQLFTKINFEERSQIDHIETKVVAFDDSGNQEYIDSFEISLKPSKVLIGDTELCPGCGCFLGGDLTPMCNHADGCGKIRKIPLAQIDEMAEDNRADIYEGKVWNVYGLCHVCKQHKPNCQRLQYNPMGMGIAKTETVCLDCKKIADGRE